MRRTTFLLSPASLTGRRAAILLRPEAAFPLAVRLRSPGGAPLGAVFSFLSGLYFRGKLTYANRFAAPGTAAPEGGPPSTASPAAAAPVAPAAGVVRVITTCRGLLPPDQPVTPDDLRALAAVAIDPTDARYIEPLAADARALSDSAPEARVVLLGSVATGKYIAPLLEVFGDRLVFPAAFVGRGDMSRGGLLLRAAADGQELDYVPVAGAARRGTRPARLSPRPGLLSDASKEEEG
jgi:hypothetical protein